MHELGKGLLAVGALLIFVGAILLLADRFGIPFGRLPGDLALKGRSFAVYFPLGTSILVSVVLSGLLYLISRFRR
jgi:hypothetical protein